MNQDNTKLVIICVSAIVIIDLIGAILVRVFVGDVPVVLGDVAKVGVGGLVMAGGLASRRGPQNPE